MTTTLLSSLLTPRDEREDGFTMVEILVVIIIIGILAAVAIPIFLNQRKAAAVAQVTTDVRNSATAMFTVKADEEEFPARIPSSVVLSEGSRVVNSLAYSGPENFCITGTHANYDDIVITFDSLSGGIVDPKKGCSPSDKGKGAAAGGDTWQEVLDDTTVLIVQDVRASKGDKNLRERQALIKAGIPEENIVYAPQVNTLDKLKVYKQVDLVVAFGGAWAISSEYANFLEEAQAAGYSVLTDGNDSYTATMPLIKETTLLEDPGAKYTPTNASVSPSFPYTFKQTAFENDPRWRCATELRDTAVAVATHTADNGVKCATAIADRNNGLWFHMTWATPEADDLTQAGILWLLG